MFSAALIWFLVGVALLLGELVVPAFVVFFFGLGCIVVAASLWLFPGLELATQTGIFVVASLVLLFSLRRLCMRILKGTSTDVAEDGLIDNCVGKMATVTKEIDPKNAGEIKFKGSFWRAVSDQVLKEGESVRIVEQGAGDRLTFRVTLFNGGE